MGPHGLPRFPRLHLLYLLFRGVGSKVILEPAGGGAASVLRWRLFCHGSLVATSCARAAARTGMHVAVCSFIVTRQIVGAIFRSDCYTGSTLL